MLNAGADPNLFRPGELALLLDRKSRRYMVTLAEDGDLSQPLGEVAARPANRGQRRRVVSH